MNMSSLILKQEEEEVTEHDQVFLIVSDCELMIKNNGIFCAENFGHL